MITCSWRPIPIEAVRLVYLKLATHFAIFVAFMADFMVATKITKCASFEAIENPSRASVAND